MDVTECAPHGAVQARVWSGGPGRPDRRHRPLSPSSSVTSASMVDSTTEVSRYHRCQLDHASRSRLEDSSGGAGAHLEWGEGYCGACLLDAETWGPEQRHAAFVDPARVGPRPRQVEFRKVVRFTVGDDSDLSRPTHRHIGSATICEDRAPRRSHRSRVPVQKLDLVAFAGPYARAPAAATPVAIGGDQTDRDRSTGQTALPRRFATGAGTRMSIPSSPTSMILPTTPAGRHPAAPDIREVHGAAWGLRKQRF